MPTARKFNPTQYWERRYSRGHDSGEGSRGEAAAAKAKYLLDLFAAEAPATVIDWGCGDGTLVQLLEDGGDATPYIGVDLSPTIVARNRERFARAAHRRFTTDPSGLPLPTAELALSVDVLHHFPDPTDLWSYLDQVMGSAGRLAAIYATDHEAGQTAYHCAWWHWTTEAKDRYAAAGWTLDTVRQGRRTKPESIDPAEPAWYLWRRTPAVETPTPKPAAQIKVDTPTQPSPGAAGPMTSAAELVAEDRLGKA